MRKLEIIVTPSAESDMKEIFDYIALDNTKKALEIIHKFKEKFESIAMFPFSGVKKSDFIIRDVRECIAAKHYQIIYHIKNNSIYILRVLTGYQDLFKQ